MLFADESTMLWFAKVVFQLPEITIIILKTMKINNLCRSHCSVSSVLSIPGCCRQTVCHNDKEFSHKILGATHQTH